MVLSTVDSRKSIIMTLSTLDSKKCSIIMVLSTVDSKNHRLFVRLMIST